MRRWIPILVALLMAGLGCASIKYVPYDPDRPWRGGYSEHKLSPDIYEVRYAAATTLAVARGEPAAQHYHEDFRLLRCAELTLWSGFQYFVVEGGVTPSHYARADTYVIKMYVAEPEFASLVFVYHAETVQEEMRRRYRIMPH